MSVRVRFVFDSVCLTLHSRNRCGPKLVRRPKDSEGQRLEVLRDGGGVELIARAGKASESHAFEVVMGLQMSKAHLDAYVRRVI
jgi:hypothetical protein